MSSSEQQDTQPTTQFIDIKILGPSEELRNGIQFNGIPKTFTIAELKERIQNELPSRPAPAKQRLIYLGRVLQPDDQTLAHFFGENVVRILIHLSLRGVDTRPLNDRDTDWY